MLSRILYSVLLALIVVSCSTPAATTNQERSEEFRKTVSVIGTFKAYRALAEQGNPIAQAELGLMYQTGDGVGQDFQSAALWYEAAVKQGDAVAYSRLGYLYLTGQGVPQDDVKAFELISSAANVDYAPAQYNLGLMYYRGRGVQQNKVLAHMWFNLANRSGHKDAKHNREVVESELTVEEAAEARKLALEWIHRGERSE